MIIYISDTHIGSKEFDKEIFESLINWIIKKQDDIDINISLNGDIIDSSLKYPFLNGQEIDVNEQLEYCIEWFSKISNLIIGANIGNHEARFKRNMPFDIHRDMCNQLKIQNNDVYSIDIFHDDNIEYVLFSKHSNGNAIRPSSRLTQLLRMKEIYDLADIYVLGHSHSHMIYIDSENRLSGLSNETSVKAIGYCYSGHCLNYGGYAIEKGYKPCGKPNFRRIELSNKKYKFRIY